ncbi:carboxylate-amine ligase [Parafrankia elaeagni]|uniref:carboxylate-amine ligase n=1 Tax=Parafrankia elaeagni TaxID=222534 RepID=UPI00037698F6|nr:glutamate--cysteine ligase [Parafrankia elaeagni]
MATSPRTFGVEEEFLLLDPDSLAVRAAAPRVLSRSSGRGDLDGELDGDLDVELTREQVESGSAPHTSLALVRGSLSTLRRAAAQAARAEGVMLAATATSPTRGDPTLTHKPRYERMRDEFGLTAREQLTCGCHVHVGIESPDEAVGALDRLRPWLSVLAALSANSPLWHGEDTGYASYRTQVWARWPTAGAPAAFGSAAEYDRVVDLLVRSGAAMDDDMIYFDARLSRHYPTLELRVADVCLSVEDAVLLAALARGLVTTAAADWADGRPVPDARPEVLRAATWRAARDGIQGELVDPVSGELVKARAMVDRLVERISPALAAAGDLAAVGGMVDTLFARGTGADRQRAMLRRRGRIADVVDLIVRETDPESAGGSPV